ncbi:carboxymuconolactone decarboxylase family protein [Streptomyces sp. NPDC086766]|uniref:carboxymuconolactone decarboxylase family protein n=1 Tax=Streptomyces sp. NPDC086766 TaxID=3365754 RepID=UPI00382887E5
MAHIEITNGLPGISGLFVQRPDTAVVLSELAETLLRSGPSPLSRGERELIAAYVSNLNRTAFCAGSHSAIAAAQLEGGAELVAAVFTDVDTAPITPLLRALLRVAGEVQAKAAPVSHQAVAAARAEGATDTHIHDTVLIAAAFAMFNRYVNGLATAVPSDASFYDLTAERIIHHGYGAAR